MSPALAQFIERAGLFAFAMFVALMAARANVNGVLSVNDVVRDAGVSALFGAVFAYGMRVLLARIKSR